MALSQYCVKAFTRDPLQGNPAAVVLLKVALDKAVMQRIAYINGFPETVFLLPKPEHPGHHYIWWFTPAREVIQAGHATLAAQHVLATLIPDAPDSIWLHWRELEGGEYHSSSFERDHADLLRYGRAAVLGASNQRFIASQGIGPLHEAGRDLVLILQSEADVRSFQPPLAELADLPYRGLCVSAPGESHDYCARFFAPAYGVVEDHVTASAHHYLAAHWSSVRGRVDLTAIQCSPSPGELTASVTKLGVEVRGECCVYSIAKLFV